MALDGHGLHHFHLRKRIHSKGEVYPNPNKKIRVLDKIIYIVGIIGPAMLLPQVIKIFTSKNAEGVSFFSYAFLAIFSIIWLLYGIVHKEKPIIITNALWIVFHLLVAIGVLIYGKGFL
ncbi:MAG: SemiSWEET family transporter [archaeon]|nr:SemiSWEET family transporter [archaeon]